MGDVETLPIPVTRVQLVVDSALFAIPTLYHRGRRAPGGSMRDVQPELWDRAVSFGRPELAPERSLKGRVLIFSWRCMHGA